MMKTIEVHRDHMKEEEDRRQVCSIHGDLLEEVFARVPLIDLACASRVSKSWEFAVTSSLAHLNKAKPWLVIQTQNTTSLAKKITSHAYDPRSNLWVEILQSSNPTNNSNSPLQCSGSNLLFELSSEGLSFSKDPLHCTWRHIPAPSAWRVDPIVAVVGPHVIVTGGGSSYLDDPLTVEMYDMEASCWSTCQPMPTTLKDSTASTWLSVASNQHMMYVTEKASGITYSFNPDTDVWFGPYNLQPEPNIYFSTIGFAGEELILAGLIGHPRQVKTLKIWKVNPETTHFEEIGEIPVELLEILKGENSCFLTSVTLLATKDLIYIYKSSEPEEIIFCDFVEGKKCKWGSVKNLAYDDDCKIGKNMVMSCGSLGIADLHMAMNSGNFRFVAKSR